MHDRLTRRIALGRLARLGLLFTPPLQRALGALEETADRRDRATFEQTMARSAELALADEPVGEVVGAIGRMFLGTPYVAHTLETEGPERLVVNLQGLDCVTFVESTLALARCVKRGATTMDDFRDELRALRYRGGTIDGYPSRLHYFTDWIAENARRGAVSDETAALGGTPRTGPVEFMSTHREAYGQLSDDEALERMREVERRLSAAPRPVIPAASVEGILDRLRTGDLLGFASTVEGLDIAHTGIAIRMNGVVRLLHASLSGGAVVVSRGSVADYLAGQRTQDGIVVARPLEPADGRRQP